MVDSRSLAAVTTMIKMSSMLNALFDACVQSSAWLDVMNILTHVAMVVRKVRGKTTPDSDSESPDYYNGGPGI